MGSNGNRLILRGSHKFRSNHCMWVASPRLLVRMGHQTKTTLVPAQPPNRQPKPTNITQHACTTCLQHSIQPCMVVCSMQLLLGLSPYVRFLPVGGPAPSRLFFWTEIDTAFIYLFPCKLSDSVWLWGIHNNFLIYLFLFSRTTRQHAVAIPATLT